MTSEHSRHQEKSGSAEFAKRFAVFAAIGAVALSAVGALLHIGADHKVGRL